MSDASIKLRDFESQILYFNGMYKLPIAPYPTSYYVAMDVKAKNPKITSSKEALLTRLLDFKKILSDELNEIDDIVLSVSAGIRYRDGRPVEPHESYGELEFLVDIADLFGDTQVFCASEMAKYGIPLKETLSIIMSSNFSKLGANGEAIYDANGKVQKGPAYWKPEPKIMEMIEEKIREAKTPPAGIVWREGE